MANNENNDIVNKAMEQWANSNCFKSVSQLFHEVADAARLDERRHFKGGDLSALRAAVDLAARQLEMSEIPSKLEIAKELRRAYGNFDETCELHDWQVVGLDGRHSTDLECSKCGATHRVITGNSRSIPQMIGCNPSDQSRD